MSDNKKAEDTNTDEAPKTGPDGNPMAEEIGGPGGPEPTRHGEWEVHGRVVDF
ncbi:MAG: DUF1674 domain-containing protein [Rhodospirillales bacterium]|nr:DUF1674 domain-containing protein [Rhodospirillales bacterium]